MTTLAIFVGLSVTALSVFGLLCSLNRKRDPYGAAVNDFIDNEMAGGATIEEAHDRLTIRREMAALRERASMRVLADPKNWIRILDEEKAASVRNLSHRRDLARRLGETVRGSLYNDILYTSAARAAEFHMPQPAPFQPTEADWAALRVVDPS